MFYTDKNLDILTLTLQKYGTLKNAEIGKCKLELKNLPNNSIVDMHIPLKNSEIELHFIAKFTPYLYDKKYSLKLPPLRINLERNFYFPGDTVRGHVILNIHKPYEFGNIILEFVGLSHVFWTTRRGDYNSNATDYSDDYHHVHKQIMLFRTDPNLPDKFTKFEAGTYIYPFEYLLDMNLPPTHYISYSSYIQYIFGSHASNKTNSFKFNYKAPIYIVKPYISSEIIYKRSYAITGNDNIKLFITRPDIIFAGEDAEIYVEIENQSDKLIEKVKIKVVRVTLLGDSFRHTSYCNNNKITSENIEKSLPLSPGSKAYDTITFKLNSSEPQTITSDENPNIHVLYHIKVTAITKGSNKNSLITPIKVVKRYSDLMRILTMPVEPESIPNRFKVSKVITSSYNNLLPPLPTKMKARFFKNEIVPKDEFDNNLLNDVIQEDLKKDVIYDINEMKTRLLKFYEQFYIKSRSPNEEIHSEPIEDKGENNGTQFIPLNVSNIHDILSMNEISYIDHYKL